MSEKIVNNESLGQQDDNFQSLSALRDKFDPIKALHLRQEKQDVKKEGAIESLKDFYDVLENPIDNDETLLSIVDAYAKEDGGFGGLYGSLQKVGIEQKESNLIDPVARQKFEEKMFERWKHSVVDMTKEEFIAAKNAGTLKSDFTALHNFVKSHPECSTEAELREAIGQIADKDISDAMFDILEKYNWNQSDGWKHVKSRYVNARQENRINVDHRFYLNTDSTSTHAIVDALVDCYEKNHLPYYFKFDEPGHRADTIVIYTSTEDLVKNLNVLHQLKKEYPELAEHFHQPPILTGVIDKNIGYGAEPEKSSYSDVRAKLLEKVLKNATVDWVAKHQNDEIRYGGKKIPFSDYVIEKEIEKLKHDFSKSFSFRLESEKKRQQAIDGRVDETKALGVVTKQLGFNQQDLQDGSKMFEYIRNQLRQNLPTMIGSLQSTGGYDLKINGRNGKEIQIGGGKFMVTLEKIAPQIAKHDKTYLDNIRKRIHEACIKSDIDPNKFVFDNSTIAKMKKQNRIDKNQT